MEDQGGMPVVADKEAVMVEEVKVEMILGMGEPDEVAVLWLERQ